MAQIPSGAGAAVGDTTVESLTISVDSVGGADIVARFVTQAEYDAHGPFETIPSAVDSLPEHLLHRVRIELPDGTFILDDEFLGNLARFTFGFFDQGFHPNDQFMGGITFRGTSDLKRAVGTTTMTVSSSNRRTVTLQSDPGLTANAFQSYFLRVISGAGAGLLKPIRSHSGAVFEVSPRINPLLNSTSVVEIVQPSTELLIDTFPTIFGSASSAMPVETTADSHLLIKFENIDIVTSGFAGFATIVSTALELGRGTRSFAFGYLLNQGGRLYLGTCIIDMLGENIWCIQGGGSVQALSNTSSWLVRNGTHGVILVSDNDAYVTGGSLCTGAIDDSTVAAIECSNMTTVKLEAGTFKIVGSGNVRALKLAFGARAQYEGDPTSDFIPGTTSDLTIDGVDKSWSDVHTELDKTLIGPHNSMVQGQ